jgi:hypothetical protein
MSRRIRQHIRNNVVGYVALFLVLTGGTAQALNGSNTVFSDDIVNREVKSADLAPRAVTANRLAPNSVRTGRVVDNSLTGTDIANLTGADVANDSLTGANIDESSLGAVPLATNAGTADNASRLGGIPAGQYVQACSDGSVKSWMAVDGTASGWPSGVFVGSPPYVLEHFSCNPSRSPTVRRDSFGKYTVQFNGTNVRWVVGTVLNASNDVFVTATRVYSSGEDARFSVALQDADGGTRDEKFMILGF